MTRSVTRALVVLCVGAAVLVGCSSPSSPTATGGTTAAEASVPTPTIQGPILPSSKISFLGSTLFSPSAVGYEQSEYFLSGTASSYTSPKPLLKNGQWDVEPATTASYKTRIVVYRPSDPAHFDGTVVVEWLNETAGIDAPAAWLSAHVQMIRSGMAYVGVDAQAGGINGQSGSLAAEDGAGALKQTDPARYGSLHHPGDSYSYSIYQQAGRAIRTSGSRLLGGLQPKRVLALGESQSALRLVTYIDALQPRSPGIYDAYFVYSRGGGAANLSQSPQPTVKAPTPTLIRSDIHVPVFLFETETDLLGLGYLSARQSSTPYLREWEIAGAAHDDSYGVVYARADMGNGVADTEAFESMLNPPKDPIPGIVDCAEPINTESHTYELRAAMVAVNRWMTTGQAPKQSPRLEVNPSDPHTFLTNPVGNALGGVRPPQVQVPVAKLSGLGQPGAGTSSQSSQSSQMSQAESISGPALCSILGTTAPFDAAQLSALYPTHADFVAKWDAATAAEVKEGYLLPADALTLDRVAAQSNVGG